MEDAVFQSQLYHDAVSDPDENDGKSGQFDTDVSLQDGLKLCPFCNATIELKQHEGLNDWYQHPENECFLSDLRFVLELKDKWNNRDGVVSN